MKRYVTGPNLAGLVGVVFILAGVIGFIPGIDHGYGSLHWWRTGSQTEIFGVFSTSILDNLVHLGFGVAGLVCARSAAAARGYLTFGGVALIGLGVYGLVIDADGGSNVFPVDRSDDWLHIGLGVAMTYAGVAVSLVEPRPAAAS